MKRLLAALGVTMLLGTLAWGETISELAAGGLVVLNSHYDPQTGVIVFLMGDIQGAPMFVCKTRYAAQEGDSFDQCRKLR